MPCTIFIVPSTDIVQGLAVCQPSASALRDSEIFLRSETHFESGLAACQMCCYFRQVDESVESHRTCGAVIIWQQVLSAKEVVATGVICRFQERTTFMCHCLMLNDHAS